MTARSDILGKIKSRQTGDETERRATVTSRLQRSPKGVIPAYGQLNSAGQQQLFCKTAKEAGASVDIVADSTAVPAAVVAFLRDNNLPAAARVGGDQQLAAMPWDAEAGMTLKHGASDGTDLVGISRATNGVAESGTLVLRSGPGNPTTINFLPDCHIVVLNASDVVGDYESSWAGLRARAGKGEMPRTVNLVTGPSRSADIGQTLIMGAHGPRQLHIILIKDA